MENIPDKNILLIERRRTSDCFSVVEYFKGSKRFFNKAYNINVVKIFAGDCYVSRQEDEMLTTILGSCVSACIHDPTVGVGGMNHFLLPGDDSSISEASDDTARYGLYAMESLINSLLKEGAQKHRLEFKLFGGGNVINNSSRIGSKNASFVRDFVIREGYNVVSADLEGEHPRSLHFYPATGKVMVRKLMRKDDFAITIEEAKYRRQISARPVEGDIELFYENNKSPDS